jgi:hypothetical protein
MRSEMHSLLHTHARFPRPARFYPNSPWLDIAFMHTKLKVSAASRYRYVRKSHKRLPYSIFLQAYNGDAVVNMRTACHLE